MSVDIAEGAADLMHFVATDLAGPVSGAAAALQIYAHASCGTLGNNSSATLGQTFSDDSNPADWGGDELNPHGRSGFLLSIKETRMGWLVIDIFIAFVIKSAIRDRAFIRSERWIRTAARVVDVTLLDPGFGCPSVRVDYERISNDHTLKGREEIPFFYLRRAKRYAQLLSDNSTVIVRVNPRNPEEMRFCETDYQRPK